MNTWKLLLAANIAAFFLLFWPSTSAAQWLVRALADDILIQWHAPDSRFLLEAHALQANGQLISLGTLQWLGSGDTWRVVRPLPRSGLILILDACAPDGFAQRTLHVVDLAWLGHAAPPANSAPWLVWFDPAGSNQSPASKSPLCALPPLKSVLQYPGAYENSVQPLATQAIWIDFAQARAGQLHELPEQGPRRGVQLGLVFALAGTLFALIGLFDALRPSLASRLRKAALAGACHDSK